MSVMPGNSPSLPFTHLIGLCHLTYNFIGPRHLKYNTHLLKTMWWKQLSNYSAFSVTSTYATGQFLSITSFDAKRQGPPFLTIRVFWEFFGSFYHFYRYGPNFYRNCLKFCMMLAKNDAKVAYFLK